MTRDESIALVRECWADADAMHEREDDREDKRLTVALLLRARLAQPKFDISSVFIGPPTCTLDLSSPGVTNAK
jgi:hypothetical protein